MARGRPRICLSYEEARAFVRPEMLKSSIEYRKWWMHNKPSRIPKNPNRAYHRKWIGWGDFLGSKNPFPCVRKKFRSFTDARSWAHAQNFVSKGQWLELCRSGKMPADIPRRPDIFYQKTLEWMTWKDFLGYVATDRAGMIGESEHIIYIVQHPELPSNVYTIGITNEGKASIIANQEKYLFTIVAGFYHDKTSDWMAAIDRYIRKFPSGERNFICNDIHSVVSELSFRYLQVR